MIYVLIAGFIATAVVSFVVGYAHGANDSE